MLFLRRVAQSSKGTFGVLVRDDLPLCLTLEDPWNDNKIGESCIVPGTYKCQPHNGAHFQNVWELLSVPGRSAILIHAGNSIDDTRGCILVGSEVVGHTIINSRRTLDMLRKVLPANFELTIQRI